MTFNISPGIYVSEVSIPPSTKSFPNTENLPYIVESFRLPYEKISEIIKWAFFNIQPLSTDVWDYFLSDPSNFNMSEDIRYFIIAFSDKSDYTLFFLTWSDYFTENY